MRSPISISRTMTSTRFCLQNHLVLLVISLWSWINIKLEVQTSKQLKILSPPSVNRSHRSSIENQTLPSSSANQTMPSSSGDEIVQNRLTLPNDRMPNPAMPSNSAGTIGDYRPPLPNAVGGSYFIDPVTGGVYYMPQVVLVPVIDNHGNVFQMAAPNPNLQNFHTPIPHIGNFPSPHDQNEK